MRKFAFFAILVLVFFSSCTEKEFVTGDISPLRFSLDTVYFDTVFTSLGTATRELRVINPNPGWIKVDRIGTSQSGSSSFRLNIDGVSGNLREDVEIAPGDSIFIFVDVIIDPNNTDNPIAVNDSIIFDYHSKQQDVNLLAWGQDINLINGEEIATETWSGTKPYVVYNSMMVDTSHILTIEKGVRVLFHRGSTMFVAGTLIVNGTVEEPVLFSSDRFEGIYDDIPGQWGGIYFLYGSGSSSIDYAVIKNSVSAIHLGNLGSEDQAPSLEISNSLIMHNTVSGISSLGASLIAENCVITHCGYFSLYLAMGGSYSFLHCTIHNYWDYSATINPGVLISDYFEYNDSIYSTPLLEASFINSVISGSLKNEIGLDPLIGESINCSFIKCLLRVDESLDMWAAFDFSDNILNVSPKFIQAGDFDLRPDTLSPLLDVANPDYSLLLDIDIRANSRFNDNGPDIGAYERQIGERSE